MQPELFNKEAPYLIYILALQNMKQHNCVGSCFTFVLNTAMNREISELVVSIPL